MAYGQVSAADLPSRVTSAPRTLDIDIPRGDDWLSAEELASLTLSILRERVRALLPLIAERARSVELNRRPDPEVWAALRKTGIFYMFVQKKFGGLEMDPEALIDVVAPIAEACASTCWCATFVIEHNLGFAHGFPLETQKKVFKASPYMIAPGVQTPPGKAVPVEGGYRVSGHWKYGSGVMNCDWVLATVLIERPGNPPESAEALVRSQDVTVLDTWRMDGMAGTGSNDIVIKDLFVPDGFVSVGGLNPNAIAPAGSPPLLRIPFLSLLSFTTMLPALGAARAAVDFAKVRSASRAVPGANVRHADKETTQARIGKADAMVCSAEVMLRDAARRLLEIGRGGRNDFDVRSRIRAQIVLALDLCRDAVRSLMRIAGASAHQLDCPMQRYVRDVEVISNHALYDGDNAYEQSGRALLGLPPTGIPF